MSTRPLLAPASAGELLDIAIGIAKRYFLTCLRIVALPYFVAGSLGYISRLAAAPVFMPQVSALVGLVLIAIVEIRLALASRDVLEGRPFGETPVAPILRKRWAAIIFGYTLKWILVIIGLFMLVVPGAYLAALYFGVPCISAFEDLGLRAARRRSRELARQHIGRVFATIGLFDVAATALGFGVLFILGHGSLTHPTEWAHSANWLIGLIAAPIRGALVAAVYLDCRIRSEGYDVDQAVAAVMPASNTVPVS